MRSTARWTTACAVFVGTCVWPGLVRSAEPNGRAARPNVLWITCEDINPHLGCYGDTYADTPHLDRFSTQALRYTHCWSTAPVCAPARTCIITGCYAPSLGAEHMRSEVSMPQWMKMAPQFLREQGYYCTNNNKEDYNVTQPAGVWDDSSAKAHWRNRRPGQPFFAVFNIEVSHESRIRTRPHTLRHDPAKAPLPAYHPDAPEVRHDWAQYYDQITEMDRLFGQRLQELKEAGLMEDTIVFFYGDNGSGMPRSKRWPYNSGLNVPLMVYVPEKFRSLAPHGYAAGGVSDRLVGFVDLAPTLLSVVGIKAPEWMQGSSFMGRHPAPAPAHAFGFRGRMDERCDMVRSVRNQRYVYVRNYMPHLIYGQYIEYLFQTPTTRVWKALHDQGKLRPPQTAFWQTKPAEELYDLQADASEVNNLVSSAQHQGVLDELRQALRQHILKTRDLGFLSEAEQHSRSAGATMYEMGHDADRYPLERILQMANLASLLRMEGLAALKEGLKDADSAVRYWAAMGLLMRGRAAAEAAAGDLQAALKDPSPSVRIAVAQTLGQYGSAMDLEDSLSVLRELSPPDKNGMYVSILALNAIEAMGRKALPLMDMIKAMPTQDPRVVKRAADYAGRLQADILRQYRDNPSASPMMWSDRSRLGRPFAKDPSVIRWAKRYLLYYSLPPSEDPSVPPGWAIGIAESGDLTNWKKIGQLGPGQDCDRKGLAAPCAIVLKDRVHLFYQTYGNGATDALCHAVSEDGVTFARDTTNPVFHPTGDWTVGRAIDAEVVAFGDRLLLFCATRDPQMKVQMITCASAALSSDFSRSCWQQIGEGPVLRPELAWERSCIEAPSVMARQGRLFMFYAGAYNNEPQQIGVAASDDGLHWMRLSDHPLLPHGQPGEWNSSESGHPGVFVDNDGQTHLFFQGNNDKGHTWFLSRMKVEWEPAGPYLIRPGDGHQFHLR